MQAQEHIYSPSHHSKHYHTPHFHQRQWLCVLGLLFMGANTHFVWLKNLAIRLSSALCSRPRSCLALNLLFQKIDGTSITQLHIGVYTNSHTRAVLKSANLENQTQMDCLVKKYQYYKKPSIESSRNFRKLSDIINDPIGWTAQKPFCLAFEWMDTTLAEVPFEEHMKDPILVASIVKVCLEAFVELEKEHLVHSGISYSTLKRSIAIN